MVNEYNINIQFVSPEHREKFLYQLEPVTAFFQSIAFKICEYFQEVSDHFRKRNALWWLFAWPFSLQYIKVCWYLEVLDVLGVNQNLGLFLSDCDFEAFQKREVLKVKEVQEFL